MKKIATLALLLCAPIFLWAQIGIDLRTYNVKEIPSYTLPSDWKEKQYKEYGIFDNCAIQYIFTENDVEQWIMNHQATVLLSEEYIKESLDQIIFEKDYIVKLKVRHFRNGEMLRAYDMEDAEIFTTEDGDKYDCIYLKDLQVMDILEYLLITKDDVSEYHGRYLQESYPIENCNFTIITPAPLKFETKVYNTEATVIDTVIESKNMRYSYVNISSMPAYPNESMASNKYRIRVEDILAYNYSASNRRLNGSQNFCTNFYANMHNLSKQEIKLTKELIKEAGIDKKMSVREIVTTWENYYKDNPVSFINNIYQLTVKMLEDFNISYQVIFTCDKTEREFDTQFDGYNYIEDILIYIPEIDYYISPSLSNFRNGVIPSLYAENGAIKGEVLAIGKSNTYIGKMTKLPIPDENFSTDSLVLNITVNPTEKLLQGDIYRSLFGYKGLGVQANYTRSSLELQEFLVETYLGLGSANTLVSDDVFKNSTPADFGIKPAVMTAKISSAEWISSENGVLEIKIGKLIGEQSKLEQKGERQLPVDKSEKSRYYRQITLTIPDGYEIVGAEKLKIEIYDDTNNPQAAFTSSYKISGNQLIVTSEEFYKKTHYPVSEFEKILRVNNAAADYNALTIQLRKKN